MQGRKLVVLMDGDGSFLNSLFEKLTTIILYRHGKWFEESRTLVRTDDVDTKLLSIMTEILALTNLVGENVRTNFTSDDIKFYRQKILENSTLASDASDKEKTDFLKAKTNDFLLSLYQFGPFGEDVHRALLFAANLRFFDFYTKEAINRKCPSMDVVSFSIRQSMDTELYNAQQGRGSFILAVERAADMFTILLKNANSDIKCYFNSYLAPDPVNKLTPGETARLIRSQFVNPGSLIQKHHASYARDRTKLMLVYLFAHYYKNADLCFVDDLIKLVLAACGKKFARNADLLPEGIDISFFHYKSQKITPYLVRPKGETDIDKYVVQGTGEVDRNIAENLKLMIKICNPNFNFEDYHNSAAISVAKKLNKSRLKEFKTKRILTPPVEVTQTLPARLLKSMTKFTLHEERKTRVPSPVKEKKDSVLQRLGFKQ